MHINPRLRCLMLLQHQTTSINYVKQIHAQLITNGLKSPSISSKLIQRYCAITSPKATNFAHRILTHFDIPSVYLVNVFIRCSLPRYSILVFAHWVSNSDLVFDDYTYLFVLGACARCAAIWEGKQIQCRILKNGCFCNVKLQTTAIHFYANNKDVGSARRVFDEMSVRNSVTWNAMITGYCSQRARVSENVSGALILFRAMLVDVGGVKPTDTTMVCVLLAASQLGVLETGAGVHGLIEKTMCAPENDVFLGTGLVDMYSKCGCLDSALCVFETMVERNVLTWTAMVTGLAVHGRGKQALELLDGMEVNGVKPNAVTFTSLLSACCHAGLVEEGLCLFRSMQNNYGVLPLIQHYGCIVDLLGRAGKLNEAYELIDGMRIEPDAVLWKSLLNACRIHGNVLLGEKVAKVLLQIQPEQRSADLKDVSEDYVALSNVYASAERWEDVWMVREEMKIRGIETKPGSSSVHSLGNHLANLL